MISIEEEEEAEIHLRALFDEEEDTDSYFLALSQRLQQVESKRGPKRDFNYSRALEYSLEPFILNNSFNDKLFRRNYRISHDLFKALCFKLDQEETMRVGVDCTGRPGVPLELKVLSCL